MNKGTRQGCPLSPLLFALSVEAPDTTIRLIAEVKGIATRHGEYKLSLFADDILLYITDLLTSLPILKQIL